MSGFDISICRSVSGVLRLPPPRKSFFVENLRAREEVEPVVADVGVVRFVGVVDERGGAVNI